MSDVPRKPEAANDTWGSMHDRVNEQWCARGPWRDTREEAEQDYRILKDGMLATLPPDCVDLIERLVRRNIVTTEPAEAATCCGLPRDEDGFCTHRPGHPIYVAQRGSKR
jgi:hypothetical protein